MLLIEYIDLGWYENRSKAEMSEYNNTKSGTWDVVSFPGKIDVEPGHEDYENGPGFQKGTGQTKVVIFTMHMKRKTLFYTVNLYVVNFLSHKE